MSDAEAYLEFVLPLIKDAGRVIAQAENVVVEIKTDISDLVTKYDRKVEEVLIERIKCKYPHHQFIGEEESFFRGGKLELTDAPTWIIDPIDGTANFVRKLPITCISVGLTVKKRICLGVIYNPFLNELYTAVEGKGAFLNGRKIQTSQCDDIARSVLNYELSLARNEKYRELYLYRYHHLIGIIQGIRSMGCAALGLCYVARGSTDAYQCDGLKPWDAAAGVLIVREAGGYVCDTSGGEFDLMDPNFLATATKKLGDQYIAIENKADAARLANTKLP